jgi:hypothetical protein
MRRFRQGSIAKRAAFGILAIYALLLQAIFSGAAPSSALASPGSIRCADDGFGHAPGGGAPAHHCPCCVLCCAAAVCTPADADWAAIVFPARVPAPIRFAPAPEHAASSFIKYHFAARGPPQDL